MQPLRGRNERGIYEVEANVGRKGENGPKEQNGGTQGQRGKDEMPKYI